MISCGFAQAHFHIRNADLILERYVYEDGYVHRAGVRETNVDEGSAKT